jgi:hypothetical protein
MSRFVTTLDSARAEVSAASSGGVPFLIAFACTLGLTGIAAFWIDVRTIALITLFQGNVALPLAFWLERRMSDVRMANDNPLKPLSIQLAMSQILALPAVLLVYQFAPAAVPAAMAGVGAAHFLPYAWLQRTRLYIVLGVAASVGPFALTILLRGAAAPWVLLYLSGAYLVAAAFIYRRARGLVRQDLAAAAV